MITGKRVVMLAFGGSDRGYQAVTDRVVSQPDGTVDAQLAHDVAAVDFDGGLGNTEFLGNLS